MTNHPITPPPELVQQWADEHFRNSLWLDASGDSSGVRRAIATQAAQWGADQELEACITWFDKHIPGYELVADHLRAARRPKPPTDKELAIRELGDAYDKGRIDDTTYDTIRRALEALDD